MAKQSTPSAKKPNILVIWGDDDSRDNISAYSRGIKGYQTPNIDRIAMEGALFTDTYAQQSCRAGRASFILGQDPVRTGLLTISRPGSPHGIPDWSPTIGDLLLASLHWLSPSKPGKAGIISIGRDPFHSTLDDDGGQIRIRDEVTLGVALVA